MTDHERTRGAGSLKRASGIVWQGIEYRIELLTLELQEDKRRLLALGALMLVALFCAFMAFLCVNVLVLILFWDTHRLAVAITMLGLYAAVAIALGTYALRRARSAPRPFTATLAELRKDRAALTRGDS